MTKPNAKDQTLIYLCNAYISTIFTMSLGGREFDDYGLVHRFDGLRVRVHSSIEQYFDIRYGSDEEKKLNRIFHSLNKHIGFPIPEYQGYGECNLTKAELKKRFAELTEQYGTKLAKLLKKEFGGK